MEPKASSQKAGISSSDFASDPEEKEFSEGEDEDDDRNHKHRRRDAHSGTLEGDSVDHSLTRLYRKRNRPFENGYPYREGDTQSDLSRFEKRRSNQGYFSRAPLELNQRIRGNQMIPSEVGYARGRGREVVSWGRRDPRLGLVDVAPQIVQPGPIPSALFPGMDLPNVSNAQSTSWNAFGLVPGIPNGGLDPLHPIGLHGALRPVISPPMNIGIPRQRCRDFEERGFCLRGDMCPMEHGVNRIVIEDVQGLSQFNLPVSLAGSQLLGTSSGQGALPVISTISSSLVNSKAFHAQNSKPGMAEDGFGLNVAVGGGSMAGTSDLYDPDQPLWTNDNPETSAALLGLIQSNPHETQSFLDKDFSDRQSNELYEGYNDALSIRNGSTGRSQSSSVWGRIGKSKRSSVAKGKSDSVEKSYLEHEIKSEEAVNTGLPNVPHQGKWTNADGNAPLIKESSSKLQVVSTRNIRKPSQKALRTLFVNGIPLKDNKREALLSHFQKFGDVIDIYIPMHSERAFVQFSNREEAEAALKAPDAVMGNRFIKLWWANRDHIPDGGNVGTSSVPITPHGMTHNSALSHQFAHDKGKEIPQPAGVKDGNAQLSLSQQTYEHPKSMVTPSSKAPQPQQKKLESLELLKEELRKKQEMLDQKRNEFKRQLDKLAKNAVGSKDVTLSEAAKSQNGETPRPKAETSNSSPTDNSVTNEKVTSGEHTVPHTTTSNLSAPFQEPMKPSFRPLAPPGAAFVVNRYKLDNRPTTFRVVPPLPAGLANVAALKEHFSAYGDLSMVELEESEVQKSNDSLALSDLSARVSFTARRFAEKAFLHGKCWQGHKLRFTWITSTNSRKEGTGSGNLSASSDVPSDANAQHSGEDAFTHSQKFSALGTREPENPAREEADADSAEQDKKDSDSGTGEPDQLAREAADADSAELDKKDFNSGTEPEQVAREAADADSAEKENKDSNSETGEPDQPAREAAEVDEGDSTFSSEKQLS